MPLRFATNSIARFSSIVSVDWDHVTGKPDVDIAEHYVAVGDGDGGFRGVAPGAVGTVLSGAGAGADPIFTSLPYLPVSLFASLQAACDATQAGNGGTVFIDTDAAIGNAAKGLNLDGFFKPLRITGKAVPAGSGVWAPSIYYFGTGSAISAIGAVNLEIDHCFVYCQAATGKVINGKDSSYLNVHDCIFSTTVSDSGNIGIDLDTAVAPRVIGNAFYITGGTGIRGVAPAGSFSVRAEIAENYFSTSTNTSIAAPGQCWRIVGNTAQNPATCFLDVGPAGTCDTVYLNGNDIDDGSGSKTWVRSNAGCLISSNNRYSNSGTCISQTNSTGGVISTGDRLEGTNGVAIGTGNYLSIKLPDQQHLPTNLYTGTPANTNVVETIGGAASITGQLSLGLSGSYAASLRFWNTTLGAHSINVVPEAGPIGTSTVTMPAITGILLTNNSTIGVTNKTLGNTNVITLRDDRFTLQDNGDTTKQGVFELSGLTTATTRTWTMPDASGTVALTSGTVSNVAAVNETASASDYIAFFTAATGSVSPKTNSLIRFNPAIPSIGLGTGAAPTSSLLDIAGGSTTLTGTTQLAVTLAPTFSSAATTAGYGFYVAPNTVAASFTMPNFFGIRIANGSKGAGSTITTQYQLYVENPTLGTTGYGIMVAGGRNNFAGSISVGTDVDRGTGTVACSASLFVGSFVVASLPSGVAAGQTAYASNCRVFNGAGTQEGGGSGTGGMVNYNGSAWKIAGTNITAVA